MGLRMASCHGCCQCCVCVGRGYYPVSQSTAVHRPSRRSSVGSERDCLVHWCHGATGVAPVLMAAASTLSRRLKEIHPLPVVTLAHTGTHTHTCRHGRKKVETFALTSLARRTCSPPDWQARKPKFRDCADSGGAAMRRPSMYVYCDVCMYAWFAHVRR